MGCWAFGDRVNTFARLCMTVLMETVTESGKGEWNPVRKRGLTRDGTAEPNSHARLNPVNFPFSATDHEKD